MKKNNNAHQEQILKNSLEDIMADRFARSDAPEEDVWEVRHPEPQPLPDMDDGAAAVLPPLRSGLAETPAAFGEGVLPPPAEKMAMSIPSNTSSFSSCTVSSVSPKGTLLPAERAEANARTSVAGN